MDARRCAVSTRAVLSEQVDRIPFYAPRSLPCGDMGA
ncbi:hypothetical protein COLO4_02323 [Corchorus olitorius]|uniref:Uncharacterized protein n=1 Tax=Corchorus olitorius TaxID=93759 RepID=A0A1R3L191_9ROSI|nr:hypothetical protein COLO4_02323 [Corchorus olitorius]